MVIYYGNVLWYMKLLFLLKSILAIMKLKLTLLLKSLLGLNHMAMTCPLRNITATFASNRIAVFLIKSTHNYVVSNESTFTSWKK